MDITYCCHCGRGLVGADLAGTTVYFGFEDRSDTRCEANPLGWHEPANDRCGR